MSVYVCGSYCMGAGRGQETFSFKNLDKIVFLKIFSVLYSVLSLFDVYFVLFTHINTYRAILV